MLFNEKLHQKKRINSVQQHQEKRLGRGKKFLSEKKDFYFTENFNQIFREFVLLF